MSDRRHHRHRPRAPWDEGWNDNPRPGPWFDTVMLVITFVLIAFLTGYLYWQAFIR